MPEKEKCENGKEKAENKIIMITIKKKKKERKRKKKKKLKGKIPKARKKDGMKGRMKQRFLDSVKDRKRSRGHEKEGTTEFKKLPRAICRWLH